MLRRKRAPSSLGSADNGQMASKSLTLRDARWLSFRRMSRPTPSRNSSPPRRICCMESHAQKRISLVRATRGQRRGKRALYVACYATYTDGQHKLLNRRAQFMIDRIVFTAVLVALLYSLSSGYRETFLDSCDGGKFQIACIVQKLNETLPPQETK